MVDLAAFLVLEIDGDLQQPGKFRMVNPELLLGIAIGFCLRSGLGGCQQSLLVSGILLKKPEIE